MKTSLKRLLPLLLVLTLPAAVQAQFQFVTNNGAITITKYTGAGGAVTIPDTTNGYPVTSIGDMAFYNATNVTSVTIGTNVTGIGVEAFYGCTSLTTVTIGNSVTNIEYYAFEGCYDLTSLTIGTNVTTIGQEAFSYCFSLTSVTLPASVTNFVVDQFYECDSLTAIIVDTNNPAYSSVAGVLFNKSQTTLIAYPPGKAGSGYTIPTNVTSIAGWAFVTCTRLTSITIPNGVTSIGNGAFNECISLTYVAIPASVTNFVGNPFFNNESLTTITVDTNNPTFSSMAGVLFNKSQTFLIQYPEDKVGSSYMVPNGVTSIGDYAFGGNNLTKVTIPDSVTHIGNYVFEYFSSLTGVYFYGNAPSLGGGAFAGDNNVTAYYLPGTAGWGTTFGGVPTALWFLPNPLILDNGPGFGVKTNRFGFIISWATNIPVVVEACTNLTNHTWSPVATNTLTGGSSYFSDPQWTNYPDRFYHLRSP
jgi:hypothetical protein